MFYRTIDQKNNFSKNTCNELLFLICFRLSSCTFLNKNCSKCVFIHFLVVSTWFSVTTSKRNIFMSSKLSLYITSDQDRVTWGIRCSKTAGQVRNSDFDRLHLLLDLRFSKCLEVAFICGFLIYQIVLLHIDHKAFAHIKKI